VSAIAQGPVQRPAVKRLAERMYRDPRGGVCIRLDGWRVHQSIAN
jgi:hypothetical protein